ncbi:MAG: hypothetical protein L0196_06055 [candidate division Zixibacteria bacterium]|nr:hypothetical protein [candidate division Zixibacteria bacterium]
MKRTLKIIQFCLPGVLAAAWWGTTLHAQEKPTLFLWQNGGIGQKEQRADSVNIFQKMDALNLKSETKAFNWSLWGTLAPSATLILLPVGLWVGPSMGYFYGGMSGRGWIGIGIRTAGMAAAVPAFISGWDGLNPDGAAQALATGGALLFWGSAIYDIATVKSAVRKHNRSLQEKALTITPAYFAQHGAPGLKVQVQF